MLLETQPRTSSSPASPAPFIKQAAVARTNNWLSMAGWVWGILCVVMLVRAFLTPSLQTVHGNYTRAGTHWLAGTDAYELHYDPQGKVIQRMSGYRYSPLFSACFVPLSLLPDQWGSVVWRAFNFVCYLGALALFLRKVVPESQALSIKQQAVWWMLLIPLSLSSMNNGQANVLMLALLLGASVAVMEERWNLAALALAGAVFLKLYPLAVAMLFVAAYPRKLGWRLLLALLAGLLVPFVLQNPNYVWDQYRSWYLLLVSDKRQHFAMAVAYRDFYLLTRWIGHPMPLEPIDFYVVTQLSAAALVAAIGVLGRLAAWPRRQLVHSLLLLGCVWMLVFGPATESCTYILMAPGLAWSLVDAFAFRRSLWTRGMLGIVLALCMTRSIGNWFPDAREWTFPMLPLAGLLFFVERCWYVCATRPEPQRSVLLWARMA